MSAIWARRTVAIWPALLFRQPAITSAMVQRELGLSQPAADAVIARRRDAGVVTKAVGLQRRRRVGGSAGDVGARRLRRTGQARLTSDREIDLFTDGREHDDLGLS